MPPSAKKKRGQSARGKRAGSGQLLDAAGEGDGVAVARLLAAGVDPNASVPRARKASAGEAIKTTALYVAAGYGRLEVVRLLLDGGADPSLARSDGITPLMATAEDGHLEVLRLLLGRGAAVDAMDPRSGCTAFHYACDRNQAECAEELVQAGCDVGLKNIVGQTGRERAEEEGHAAVVTRLRAVVAEQLRRAVQAARPALAPEPVAVSGDGGPAAPLVMAATEGDLGAAVARLLAAGADPNASVPGRMPSGEVVQSTALCEAVVHGHLEAVRLLLDGGADPSSAGSDGTTPLMAAAGGGQLEVLQLLLGRGAAVDAVEPGSGCTAFHSACYHNQPDCVEALARVGCDVGIKDNDGFTGREMAEGRCHAAVVERLRAVVAEQLRVAPEPAAVSGDGGLTAQLVTAVGEGNGAVVARLLAAGADPNASVPRRMPSGKVFQDTALCIAAGLGLGRLEVARLLLDAGADPSLASSDGGTPLMAAVGCGDLEVLWLLIGRGATVDAANHYHGFTAFHGACYSNHAECVEALVRAGCDVGLKDKSGMTGRERAEAQDSKDTGRWLRALARQPFVGVLVELAGLVGAAEHNGKRAMVMSERPSRGHHTSAFLPRARMLSALCASLHNAMCDSRMAVELTTPSSLPHTPPAVPGAAPPAAEAALHARAAGAAGWGWRRGEAHGRATGELCAGTPAGRHTVRLRQDPGGSIGFRRCIPVFVKSA
jgi:ankyrin repeat protein